MEDPAPDPNVFYAYQRCNRCCQWPGQVKLRDEEVVAIARFLEMDVYQFTDELTRLRPGRDGLSLIDQADGSCVFLQGGGCAIQPVKPQQCRDFPNKWNFPGWRAICEAIPVPRDASEPS